MRETERQREAGRQRQTEAQKNRNTETQGERESDIQIKRQRDRQRQRDEGYVDLDCRVAFVSIFIFRVSFLHLPQFDNTAP